MIVPKLEYEGELVREKEASNDVIPAAFEFAMSRHDYEQLKTLGDLSTVIAIAVRGYFSRNNDQFPRHVPSLANYGDDDVDVDVVWLVPDDLQDRIPWNKDTGQHLRAACRAFLRANGFCEPVLVRVPKRRSDPIEVYMSGCWWRRLKALGGSPTKHFEQAIREFAQSPAGRQSVNSPPTPVNDGTWTTITWDPDRNDMRRHILIGDSDTLLRNYWLEEGVRRFVLREESKHAQTE